MQINSGTESKLDITPKKLEYPFELEKDLEKELKNLKGERRYHNRFVKDPLSSNLEVPQWVINERKEILAYLNDYRRENGLTELKEYNILAVWNNKHNVKDYVNLAFEN